MLKQAIVLSSLLFGSVAAAQDVDFKVSAGFPYFLIGEVSTDINEDYTLFANYKMGLDDGFSVGVTKSIFNEKHNVSLFAGAVGTDKPDCNDSTGNETIEGAASDFLSCSFSIMGTRSLNGLGLRYDYTLFETGASVSVDFGRGTNDYVDGYESSAGFYLNYRF